MKLKYIIAATVTLFCLALAGGLYCKTFYKDYNKEEKPLDHFSVAILPDDLADQQIETMGEKLGESRFIIAARCETTPEFLFSNAIQSVTIEKVFQGEGLREGDTIRTQLIDLIFLDEDGYAGDKPSVNIGFVNAMTPGRTYLLFLDKKVDMHDGGFVYIQSEEVLMRPVFCYDEIPNTPCVSVSEVMNSTYYETVKENEFFLESQETIDKMVLFKKELLKKYAK